MTGIAQVSSGDHFVEAIDSSAFPEEHIIDGDQAHIRQAPGQAGRDMGSIDTPEIGARHQQHEISTLFATR
ncbi:hypothetical protein FA224_28575 [Pseudomonas aeruginosa]|jgi:hypothetical protein|nr:hypothetical protein AI22_13470 [Pseudomonas aeruginosa YL84]EME95944.1 hypothetical protein H123_02155 [Pseudomonas aeruginosa PA21_ST175]EQM89357.1 hypothetical protein L683_01500 [Pseudomonas aeruginosa WC55]ERF08158.1 hypothetical protein PA13_1010160 [Pseudomonas aeruginosa HB13]KEA13643.1 hypothetical protein BH78_05570 [Pseudomonas aeruginosa C1913C]KEA15908.1 hypothetical protein Y905_22825 [Pseudomonas aeruginosa C2159M]KEA25441.1 hypothetical protein BH77_11150 [Pseudomonas aerug